MDTLTLDDIAAILATTNRVNGAAPAPKRDLGSFESRKGSVRRNRKGRTRILPNGYAFYCPTIAEWKTVGLCRDL